MNRIQLDWQSNARRNGFERATDPVVRLNRPKETAPNLVLCLRLCAVREPDPDLCPFGDDPRNTISPSNSSPDFRCRLTTSEGKGGSRQSAVAVGRRAGTKARLKPGHSRAEARPTL